MAGYQTPRSYADPYDNDYAAISMAELLRNQGQATGARSVPPPPADNLVLLLLSN